MARGIVSGSGTYSATLDLTVLEWRNKATGHPLGAVQGDAIFSLNMSVHAGAGGVTWFALVSNIAADNAKTAFAMREFVVPPDYVAGTNFTVTVNGSTVGDEGAPTLTVKTVNVFANLMRDDEADAADYELLDGSAQNLAAAHAITELAFTVPGIVPAGPGGAGTVVQPGDRLYLELAGAITEAGAGGGQAHIQVNSVRVTYTRLDR